MRKGFSRLFERTVCTQSSFRRRAGQREQPERERVTATLLPEQSYRLIAPSVINSALSLTQTFTFTFTFSASFYSLHYLSAISRRKPLALPRRLPLHSLATPTARSRSSAASARKSGQDVRSGRDLAAATRQSLRGASTIISAKQSATSSGPPAANEPLWWPEQKSAKARFGRPHELARKIQKVLLFALLPPLPLPPAQATKTPATPRVSSQFTWPIGSRSLIRLERL